MSVNDLIDKVHFRVCLQKKEEINENENHFI